MLVYCACLNNNSCHDSFYCLGIHYIGTMENMSECRDLMDQLTSGQLEWAKMADEFDVVSLVSFVVTVEPLFKIIIHPY